MKIRTEAIGATLLLNIDPSLEALPKQFGLPSTKRPVQGEAS